MLCILVSPFMVLVKLGLHWRTTAVIADGEYHRHWVRNPSQIRALPFCFESISMVATGSHCDFELHTVDRSCECEPALLVLCKGANWKTRGERACLAHKCECH